MRERERESERERERERMEIWLVWTMESELDQFEPFEIEKRC